MAKTGGSGRRARKAGGASGGASGERARRVAIGGELLDTGRHQLRLVMPGADREVTVGVVVGERRGPRALVIGGTSAHDGNGLEVARRLAGALDPATLAGSVITLALAGLHDEPTRAGVPTTAPDDADDSPRARATRWLLALLTDKAAFGIEVRSGPPGRATWPHLRADLADERLPALARAFGAEVIVDTPGGPGSLRRAAGAAGVPTLVFEGAEAGRHDDGFCERAYAGVLSLLRARRMLPGKPARPPWRATVAEASWLPCPATGWLTPLCAPGALVAAGEVLARVHDAGGRALAELCAPGRAIVLAAPALAHAEAATPLVLLGKLGPRALARAAAHRAVAPRHRIGWCEWVALPELGIGRLHAKIDTGARTSALHVRAMHKLGDKNGRPVYEVRLPTGRHPNSGKSRVARVEIDEFITVRDSGGHEERRPVITTSLALGPVSRRVRVSLTDRGDMLFPMLIGRSALGEDFVVDAAARNLLG